METRQTEERRGLWSRYKEISREVHRGFIAEWTVTIVLLLFATTTLVQAFVIPSASMQDTLLIGDHVLVDKLVYAPSSGSAPHLLPYREVRRGDIIVFRYPLDISQDYVKRAIGLPGDRIHLEAKKLWLNGHPVDEPYVVHSTPYINEYRDNFPLGHPDAGVMPRAIDMVRDYAVNGDLVVPKDFIFAMGDNRDDSADSRYWGLVPRDNIVGTPLIIYWSFEAPTADLVDPNIGIGHILDVIIHFPTKTRWGRTFKLIHGYPLR